PDGISTDELDSMIEGGVEYLGKMDDVRPAIADASVYVLPSYREGTPRSVLEAMAMGRPVVTTDAPGCREPVVDGENGFLVPLRDLGRPIFFRQKRPGLHGRPFEMIKFRTMRNDASIGTDLSRDAQRLTKLGRFLRAASLDELPELWNVLKGDMSLVGPRPLLM